MTINLLDVVILTRDIPEHDLRVGDHGTVVDVTSVDEVFVEFVEASGHTRALVTLPPTDLREATDEDLRPVRSI